MKNGPMPITTCPTSEPLGALLIALGRCFNCTSKLSIKPSIPPPRRKGEDVGDRWELVISEPPFYTSEAIAYAEGFVEGRETTTVRIVK